MKVKIKRAYEVPTEADGKRVLVDRLWPRGIAKQNLRIDYWLKEIAPSSDLRKWFGHDPDKFLEFKQHYIQELTASTEKNAALKQLVEIITIVDSDVTLIFAAKDEVHNQAVVLQEFLAKIEQNPS